MAGIDTTPPSPLRVLIVDDQASFRDVARDLLHARGHVVVAEAESAHAAIDALQRSEPDAVLLDLRLGGDNGFDVAQALTRAKPGLAVLLVSVDDAGVLPDRVRECGACGFLLKRRLVSADLERLWRSG